MVFIGLMSVVTWFAYCKKALSWQKAQAEQQLPVLTKYAPDCQRKGIRYHRVPVHRRWLLPGGQAAHPAVPLSRRVPISYVIGIPPFFASVMHGIG
jgi:tRNA(His) 5'-end guanylyltransferase